MSSIVPVAPTPRVRLLRAHSVDGWHLSMIQIEDDVEGIAECRTCFFCEFKHGIVGLGQRVQQHFLAFSTLLDFVISLRSQTFQTLYGQIVLSCTLECSAMLLMDHSDRTFFPTHHAHSSFVLSRMAAFLKLPDSAAKFGAPNERQSLLIELTQNFLAYKFNHAHFWAKIKSQGEKS